MQKREENRADTATCKEQLVSVIMPVYNGEKVLKRALASVAAQKSRPLELVAVDDGSTDRSCEILKEQAGELEKQGICLRLVRKENEGIARTRNRGIEEAMGSYLMFMDQDDWLKEDCVETLKRAAMETDANLVIGGFIQIDENDKVREKWILDPKKDWSKFRITAPWGRIFKRQLIEEKKIRFFDTKISEDLYFNLLFMSHAKKVEVIPYAGYYWFYHENSESHRNWSKMSDDRNPLIMLDALQKDMGKSDILTKEQLTFFFAKYLVWYVLFCGRGASKEQTRACSREVFGWLDVHYPDYKKLWWKSLGQPAGETFQVRMSVAVTVFLKRIGCMDAFLAVYRRL